MKNDPKNKLSRDSSSISIWQEGGYDITKRSLNVVKDKNKVYDCLIIGAGITGITTALLLQQSGLSCAIAEAKQPGYGTTGGTSAHLNTFFDASYLQVEKDFGRKSSKLLFQAGTAALDLIKNLVDDLKIDCDLESKSAWLFAENEKESIRLKEILNASKRSGSLVKTDNKNLIPIPFHSAIRFDGQAQFHPLKYINGLLDEYIRLGGIIFLDKRIRSSAYSEGIHKALSDNWSIQSKNLIYATHIPPHVNIMSFKNAPYRSYVLALKLKDSNYPDGLIYDMREPYHYFRTHTEGENKYLLVGGEDHKTGHHDPGIAFQRLEDYAGHFYEIESVAYKWSAQYYVPVDGLPYIGHLPDTPGNIYMATGFNGNGMIYGTLAAQIISDLILNRKNKFTDLFNPFRIKPVAGFKGFIKENADVIRHFIADRFVWGQTLKPGDVNKGEGRLLRFNGRHLAIYKDKRGHLIALNPVCTHAGCIVQFNDVEKSWDCPCHGGRFDVTGKVLCGPPTKDLEKVSNLFDS